MIPFFFANRKTLDLQGSGSCNINGPLEKMDVNIEVDIMK